MTSNPGSGGNEGGPWGQGSADGSPPAEGRPPTPPKPPSPWARGPDGSKGSGSGGGAPRRPPELDRIIESVKDRLRRPGGGPVATVGFVLAAALVLLGLWLASGFYRVLPDEEGVVLRFGAYSRTTQAGLHWHLPSPLETVFTPKVTFVNKTDIGGTPSAFTDQNGEPNDALMLTGDENIVDIHAAVFWKVKDARAYLFSLRNADLTVKSAAESAVREIVGRTPIAAVLAEGRHQVEVDTQTLLQSILDSYDAGVLVTEVQLQKVDPPEQVIEAFRDVQRARADQERARNEAEAYHNDVVPRARGQAAQITQEALAYKAQAVARASGDADRFNAILQAYRTAKDVTAERLYIDAMEQVLRHADKIITDKAGSGVLPYLPLPPPGGHGAATHSGDQK